MNPNSQNQWWSKWSFVVLPGRPVVASFAVVKSQAARFGRMAFGSGSQMRIRQRRQMWTFEILTEGTPVTDDMYVEFMSRKWEKAFEAWFGPGTRTRVSAKLKAGSWQDGRPAEQLLILPGLSLDAKEIR